MVKEYKRFVIDRDCTGCKTCDVACKQEHGIPVGLRWMELLQDGPREIDGKMQLKYSISDCMHYNKPPCREACPAGLDAYGYITQIAKGKFDRALEVIRDTMPFAGVCGRVCTHPCELVCEKGKVGDPVAIRLLKRFIADYELTSGRKKTKPIRNTGKAKIAIVGSGPAGISCAYDLIREGYPVTVFESAPLPGGMLRYAIPEYRLPKAVLDNELNYVQELGVEIRTGSLVNNLDEIFKQGYRAIFIGTGAWVSKKMGIPGEDTPGVTNALDFLKNVSEDVKTGIGEKVAVVGGGNAAIDAARTALRLGSKEIHLLYRRSRAEMPAISSEVDEMEREGVKIHYLTTPTAIIAENGRLTGIKCIRMELGDPDLSGRRRPVTVEGSDFEMEVDTVIIAVGQAVTRTLLPENTGFNSNGTVIADPVTFQTCNEGVFAGGDAVSGPADVIQAIATGKEAAVSIDRYLRGMDLSEGRSPAIRKLRQPFFKIEKKRSRPLLPTPGSGIIINSFEEVAPGLTEAMAVEEAQFCFSCGICREKLEHNIKPACAAACSARCIHFDT